MQSGLKLKIVGGDVGELDGTILGCAEGWLNGWSVGEPEGWPVGIEGLLVG